MASCYREARASERDSQQIRAVQLAVLQRIVRRNRDTWFGRAHRFASIGALREFQKAVPLSTYDDYRCTIERIAGGEQNVLTADRVRLLQPTGGATGCEKLIPYTSALQRSFQRAIRVWIWNLCSQRPRLRRALTPRLLPDEKTMRSHRGTAVLGLVVLTVLVALAAPASRTQDGRCVRRCQRPR